MGPRAKSLMRGCCLSLMELDSLTGCGGGGVGVARGLLSSDAEDGWKQRGKAKDILRSHCTGYL